MSISIAYDMYVKDQSFLANGTIVGPVNVYKISERQIL